MHHPDHNASPFNAVPPVVVLIALAMFVIECAVELGGAGYVGGPAAVGWRNELIERFGLMPLDFRINVIDARRLSFDNLAPIFAYPFVHASFVHMFFAAVFTLALGKFVGEIFSGLALTALWLAVTVLPGLFYVLVAPSNAALIGGMPAGYGLIGAFTFLLWQRARAMGTRPWVAFRLIGMLVAMQLAFGAIQGGPLVYAATEFAGFASGFVLSFALSPGGWTHLVALLRQR
jgi:membrane associated rhomboid family serine protease